MRISDKWKAVVAGVSAVAVAASAAVADNVLDMNEGVTLLVLLGESIVAAWVVWRVPNRPAGQGN